MGEHESSLTVRIICHNETLKLIAIGSIALLVQVIGHHQLKDLSSFTSWSCTHVKHCMVGLDVKEEWREHANYFLSCE